MTPEEIKAKGYTILTDPSEISSYNIIGQYGQSGAKGSFLYGTQKASGNLQGTLPPEDTSRVATTPTTSSSVENRSLPQAGPGQDNSFANLRSLLTQATRLSAAKGPTAEDYLSTYKKAGLELDPAGMASALREGRANRADIIGDKYKSALDLINEQEKNQQEYLSTVMSGLPKAFLATMSGKEWDEIKSGSVSPELKERISQAQSLEGAKPASITEQLAAREAGYDIVNGKLQEITPQADNTSITQQFPQGSVGKECGVQTHEWVDNIPTMGDLYTEKKKTVDTKGIPVNQWKNDPKVGDVLIFDTLQPYGHAAMVNSINPDGTITLSESNWKKTADGKPMITHDRKININDQTLYGALRGNLKQELQTTEKIKNTTSDGYDIEKFTQKFYNTDLGQKVLNNEQQYQTSFLSQQAIKDFIVVQNKAATVKKIIDMGVGGPGDLAMVFEFMKALDPTSVVRESEYETAAKSGNIFAGAYARFNGYLKEEGGFLPENVKRAFVDITQKKLEVNTDIYNQIRGQFRKNASEQGLNPEHVAPDLIINSEENTTAEQPQTMKVGEDVYVLQPNGKYKKTTGASGSY